MPSCCPRWRWAQLPQHLRAEDALAQGRALKDRCLAAWRNDPARAVDAAQSLRALADAAAGLPGGVELQGLALWCAGIVSLSQGLMAPAVQRLDAAAALLRQAGQADGAAQTQVPKVMALSMLGQHAAALACGEAARSELLALGNVGAAARVSQNLGSLQSRRDAYAEAARHFRQAAVLFARLGDDEHSIFADIGLGDALTATGDVDEARRIYARARMRAGHRQLQLPLALVDEALALADLACGSYRQALAGLESARRRFQALALPQYLAIAEKQLADTYLELRLLPEALSMFEAAVATFASLAWPDEQAWALVQQGRTQALMGRAAAGASFAAAAALFALQAHAVGSATVALARADIALAAGDAASALALGAEALQGYTEAEQADGRARAQVLCAMALLQAGQPEQAQAALRATLERAVQQQQSALQLRCLTGLGLAAQALGQAAEAERAFEAAIELFEDQRRALPADEIRSAFLGHHLRPYQERLRAAVAAGDGALALWQLDRFRARALDERLAEGAPAPADDAALDALRTRLNWLYRRVPRLQDEGTPSQTLSQEMQRTEALLLEGARRQWLTAPPPALQPGTEPFSVEALQAALQPAEALVEYGVLDDELFACVLTVDGVRLCRHLALWGAVVHALRAARFQIETLSHGAEGAAGLLAHLPLLQQRTQLRLAQVQALVWAPLAAALQGVRRVLLVPHGQLASLPFAALPLDGCSLGQVMELAQVVSARAALRGLRRPALPARHVLAIGESSRLAHAAREAQAVAALLPQGQARVGAAATLAALRRDAPQADVLHLACHAQFRADNPRFSALHLADGALTVEQVEGLGLAACTVVLSACETGLADVVNDAAQGNEQVGLVRAFLVAGAARVLASLWPVDDAVTAAFMSAFYGALGSGLTPAAALVLAQDATRSTHPHPCFWAAFTLHGGW